MDYGAVDKVASLEAPATLVEQRAERVREHATRAREEAAEDAAAGFRTHESLHLSEPNTHEQSATLLMRTASLYRKRARDLRARR